MSKQSARPSPSLVDVATYLVEACPSGVEALFVQDFERCTQPEVAALARRTHTFALRNGTLEFTNAKRVPPSRPASYYPELVELLALLQRIFTVLAEGNNAPVSLNVLVESARWADCPRLSQRFCFPRLLQYFRMFNVDLRERTCRLEPRVFAAQAAPAVVRQAIRNLTSGAEPGAPAADLDKILLETKWGELRATGGLPDFWTFLGGLKGVKIHLSLDADCSSPQEVVAENSKAAPQPTRPPRTDEELYAELVAFLKRREFPEAPFKKAAQEIDWPRSGKMSIENFADLRPDLFVVNRQTGLIILRTAAKEEPQKAEIPNAATSPEKDETAQEPQPDKGDEKVTTDLEKPLSVSVTTEPPSPHSENSPSTEPATASAGEEADVESTGATQGSPLSSTAGLPIPEVPADVATGEPISPEPASTEDEPSTVEAEPESEAIEGANAEELPEMYKLFKGETYAVATYRLAVSTLVDLPKEPHGPVAMPAFPAAVYSPAMKRAITDAVVAARPRPANIRERGELRQELEKLFRETLGTGTGGDEQQLLLYVFGSSSANIFRWDSDMDLCLVLDGESNGHMSRAEVQTALMAIYRVLNANRYGRIQRVLNAKVPIIKKVGGGGMNFDVSLAFCGVRNSTLLRSYVNSKISIVQPLAMTIVSWSKLVAVNNSPGGYFSTYTVMLMLVYFLLRIKELEFIPIETPLELTPDPPYKLADMDVDQTRVTELLFWFFWFYAREFQYDHLCVQIRTPNAVPRSFKNWELTPLAVEDPYETHLNTARHIGDKQWREIRAKMDEALLALEEGGPYDNFVGNVRAHQRPTPAGPPQRAPIQQAPQPPQRQNMRLPDPSAFPLPGQRSEVPQSSPHQQPQQEGEVQSPTSGSRRRGRRGGKGRQQAEEGNHDRSERPHSSTNDWPSPSSPVQPPAPQHFRANPPLPADPQYRQLQQGGPPANHHFHQHQPQHQALQHLHRTQSPPAPVQAPYNYNPPQSPPSFSQTSPPPTGQYHHLPIHQGGHPLQGPYSNQHGPNLRPEPVRPDETFQPQVLTRGGGRSGGDRRIFDSGRGPVLSRGQPPQQPPLQPPPSAYINTHTQGSSHDLLQQFVQQNNLHGRQEHHDGRGGRGFRGEVRGDFRGRGRNARGQP